MVPDEKGCSRGAKINDPNAKKVLALCAHSDIVLIPKRERAKRTSETRASACGTVRSRIEPEDFAMNASRRACLASVTVLNLGTIRCRKDRLGSNAMILHWFRLGTRYA